MQGPSVPLRADTDLIRRVFINLIGNALKFTPKGGEVIVTTSTSDGLARAQVHDTGSGIPEEYHERIFEKFGQVEARRQGHEHSSGLGLTFCRLAVVAHGGRIGVRNRVSKGSTFWFVLPITSTNDPNSEPGGQASSEHVQYLDPCSGGPGFSSGGWLH